MRWLFVGIVALNVLYFGWAVLAGDDPARHQAASGPEPQSFPAELRLLQEAGASVAAPAVIVAPAASRPQGCPAIGPFGTPEAAAEVLEVFADAGVDAVQQGQGKAAVPLYWVYLPPHETRQHALRRLRELHAAGIDSFIVGEGADANAVSLGSFGNRDSALGLQARLRTAGYLAQVREQMRQASDFWIVLREPGAQGFMEFVPAARQSGLIVKRAPCP